MALGAIAPGVAQAGSQVDAAVQALGSAPIYSAPGAQLGLSSADRSRVERAIAQEEPGPLYIAVLPDRARAETGGDTNELVREIATALRRPGTYVGLAGRQLRAASTHLAAGEAGRLAGDAVSAQVEVASRLIMALRALPLLTSQRQRRQRHYQHDTSQRRRTRRCRCQPRPGQARR